MRDASSGTGGGLAIIGDAALARALAEVVTEHAEADLEWSVFGTDPLLDAVAGEHRVSRDVTSAFAFDDHVQLLLGNDTMRVESVIVAAGARARVIEGERELRGRGVSYCARCDGALARGKHVIAAVESPHLEQEIDFLREAGRLDVLRSHGGEGGGIVAVHGEGRVEEVTLADGGRTRADAVFILTSEVPLPVLVPGAECDGDELLRVDRDGRTSLPLVFAVGPGTVGRDDGVPVGDLDRTVRSAVQPRPGASGDAPARR